MFAFGLNNEGQLGLGFSEYESCHIPKCLGFFKEKVVTWVSAGSSHSGALTVEGYLYTWGSNQKGQLSQSEKSSSNVSMPKIVENLLGRGIC